MVLRFCLALFVLALFAPLHGQDQPVHTRPEFPLIFPFAQNDKDVSVKYPVMINPTTVLKPGCVLHVIYVLSTNMPGSSDLALAHKGNMDESYARASAGVDHTIPPNLAHEIEGYRRTIWQVSNNFVLAMAQYPTDAMHLIYTTSDKSTDLHDERFSFFDGLLVGSPSGKVTVLAVEKRGKTEIAGIQAGDEIVSLGGIPTHDDLPTFAAAYAKAKKAATENEVSSYAVVIRSDGSEKTVQVPMPPKIRSSLMDDFYNEKPTPLPPATPTAPSGAPEAVPPPAPAPTP